MPTKSSLTLAVNPKTSRQEDDFYATDPNALRLFLDRYYEDGLELNHDVWEPACGQGHLSKVLEEYGHRVLSTDLVDRGYGQTGIDFCDDFLINLSEYFEGDILTNPPFKLAEQFVEKGMERLRYPGNRLILFLKIQFLEGKKRKKLFAKYPPKYVYLHSERQLCSRNAEFEKYNAATLFFAWYVWEKGFNGETIIRWI